MRALTCAMRGTCQRWSGRTYRVCTVKPCSASLFVYIPRPKPPLKVFPGKVCTKNMAPSDVSVYIPGMYSARAGERGRGLGWGNVGPLVSPRFRRATPSDISARLRRACPKPKRREAQASLASLLFTFGGETEIRTPDTLLEYTRFPGVPLKPLEHLSLGFPNFGTANIRTFSETTKIICTHPPAEQTRSRGA